MRHDLFDPLLEALLTTSLALAVALVVVLALRAPFRRIFGAGAAYALWSSVPAVLLALALPVPSSVVSAVPALREAAIFSPISGIPADAAFGAQWWILIWLIGVVVCVIMLVVRQRRLHVALGELQASAEGILRSSSCLGPLLLGTLRPQIVLPHDFEQRYDAEERTLILAHERAHCRRRDPWANLLAAALRALFWFHPLVLAALPAFRRDQELSCDALVLAHRPYVRGRYAGALLKADASLAPLLACSWPSVHPVKERIMMLRRPIPNVMHRLAGLVSAVALVMATAAVAWAAQWSTFPAEPPGDATSTVFNAPPHYPAEALRQRIEGDVVLRVLIDDAGSPQQIEVEQATPPGYFEDAARQAVAQWRFAPLAANTSGWVRVPIQFRLNAPVPR